MCSCAKGRRLLTLTPAPHMVEGGAGRWWPQHPEPGTLAPRASLSHSSSQQPALEPAGPGGRCFVIHFKSTNPGHLLCPGVRDPEKNKSHSLVHSTSRCLLSIYDVPSTALCTGDAEMKKMHSFIRVPIQHIVTKHLRGARSVLATGAKQAVPTPSCSE